MDDRTRVFQHYGYKSTFEPAIKALSKDYAAPLEMADKFRRCPRCGWIYSGEPAKLNFIEYCYKCGQALEWEVR